jgi:hypothetical protein
MNKVIWVKHCEPGNPAYNKNEGDPFIVIGNEGENILLVTRSTKLFIPIFELFSTKSLEDVSKKVLDRMEALAKECLTLWGSDGTIFGVFRNSSRIQDENDANHVVYVLRVGLACTTLEFTLPEPHLTPEECVKLGLPSGIPK